MEVTFCYCRMKSLEMGAENYRTTTSKSPELRLRSIRDPFRAISKIVLPRAFKRPQRISDSWDNARNFHRSSAACFLGLHLRMAQDVTRLQEAIDRR